MSDFDYFSRDVRLPQGDADLIEAFQQAHEAAALGELQHTVTKGTPADIEKNISSAFEAPKFLLSIASPDKRLHLDLGRNPPCGTTVSVVAEMGGELENRLRVFFQERRVAMPDRSIPGFFNPNLPVELICTLPPAKDPVQLAALATDLFRDVCGLTSASDLTFSLFITAGSN